MKSRSMAYKIIFLFVFIAFGVRAQEAIYLNPSKSVEKRVEDLLSRMTLEEKVGQMCQYVGPEHIKRAEKAKGRKINADAWGFYKGLTIKDLERMVENGEIGSFLHVTTAKESNYLQSLAMKSRLRIPILFGDDAIHGVGLTRGATVYPSPITLAASFDTELVRTVSEQTAHEFRSLGLHWTFTPNIDVARDARWGRVGETFGEDPFLVAQMGTATIKGFQENKDAKTLACAKHLIAGSEPANGLNSSPMDISERGLREIYLPPYKAAVQAGVYTIMTAHNELNGVPCHANKWIIDIMRMEYGFGGFIVSDWMDIERLHNRHFIAETRKDASYLAVSAGVDMHMHGPGFYDDVIELVKEGRLSEKQIDKAVAPILKAKFELGLFEKPFVDVNASKKILFNKEHRQTALEAARESIVLLKNDGLLPIDESKYDKILITGPNADSHTILGDWTLEQPEANVITALEGFRKIIKEKNKLQYFDCGKSVKHIDEAKIKEAVELAKKSDLIILVMGENPLRYMPGEKTSGENVARSDIKLPGNQLEFVKEIHKTGKPIAVVLINGRPLGVEWISENIPAALEAFEPGTFGGEAVAEILLGKVNPSGKLPITFPRNAGQIKAFYNHKPSQYTLDYADCSRYPLYDFGYGLSYTEFEFGEPTLSKEIIGKKEKAAVSIDIKNIGERDGTEVVQLYIRDDYSSVTRPVKELKGFRRVFLKAGESKTVKFEITPEMLAFYDLNMNFVVEPGAFTIMIGSSSRDEDLRKIKLIVK